MKFLVILGAVFFTQSALAEVGTRNPESVEKQDSVLELALAEKGAGISWTNEPLKFEATAHQTAKLNQRVEQMNEEVSKSLNSLIAEKLEQAINK